MLIRATGIYQRMLSTVRNYYANNESSSSGGIDNSVDHTVREKNK